MTLNDLVFVYGNKARAARATGYARCTMTLWQKMGIPYETQCRLYYDFKKLRKFKPDRAHAPASMAKAG